MAWELMDHLNHGTCQIHWLVQAQLPSILILWDQHLADEYDQDEDILRFKVKPTISEEIQEELVFDIESIDQSKGRIHFRWERASFSFYFINN